MVHARPHSHLHTTDTYLLRYGLVDTEQNQKHERGAEKIIRGVLQVFILIQ